MSTIDYANPKTSPTAPNEWSRGTIVILIIVLAIVTLLIGGFAKMIFDLTYAELTVEVINETSRPLKGFSVDLQGEGKLDFPDVAAGSTQSKSKYFKTDMGDVRFSVVSGGTLVSGQLRHVLLSDNGPYKRVVRITNQGFDVTGN